jgi:hypothetical protein
MSRYMYVRDDHAGSPYQPILNVSLYALHFLSVLSLLRSVSANTWYDWCAGALDERMQGGERLRIALKKQQSFERRRRARGASMRPQ